MRHTFVFILAAMFVVQTVHASTCGQCLASGSSYICNKHGNGYCHDTEATCLLTCWGGRCSPTSGCGPNMTCPNPSMCNPSNSTCCMTSDSTPRPFCAPYANATCCNYQQLACPGNQACDPITNACVPPNTNTPSCQKCINLMNSIEKNGCEKACQGDSSANLLCQLISYIGCSTIENELKKFENPARACGIFGVCGGGDCPCGLCTPLVYGENCLSFPNKCPPQMRDGPMKSFREIRKAFEVSAARSKNLTAGKALCLDGQCSQSNLGCCLTCV